MTEWQTKKLGDIATIKRGGSPRPIKDYLVSKHEEGYSWLKIGDVPAGSRYIFKTSAKIRPEGLKKTTLVKKGDFILSNSMSFGRPYIMMTDACIHDGWLALQDIDESANKQFLYYLLASELMQNKFKNYSAGSGVQNLKKETVQEIDFETPEKAEQGRIVGVLEVWDEYLEKLEQKIKLKEQLKKGLMQQLLTGKKRLPGFSREWKECRLQDLAQIKKGEQRNKNTLSKIRNVKMWFPVMNGGIQASGYTNENNAPAFSITISEGGNSCGYVNLIGERFWCGGHCYRLIENDQVDKFFLFVLLKLNEKRIMSMRVGSGLPNIQKKTLEKMKFYIPMNKEEQQAISKVLLNILDEISLLRNKKQELHLQKKYILKNLITGKIRTPENLRIKGAE